MATPKKECVFQLGSSFKALAVATLTGGPLERKFKVVHVFGSSKLPLHGSCVC